MPKRREHNSGAPNKHRQNFDRVSSNSFFSIIKRAKEGERILAITRELEKMPLDEVKQLRGFIATELNRLKNLYKISPERANTREIANLEALLRITDGLLRMRGG